MWDQLKEAVFDATEASGLNSGFLGDVVAEAIGVILSILISVLFAMWLDQGREVRRRRDHRKRAVTRWVNAHERMLADVKAAGGQSSNGAREAMLKGRELIVENAKSDARDVWSDYEGAFHKRKMFEAFEDYLRTMEALRIEVGRVQIWSDSVKAAALTSIDRLQRLVKISGDSRQSRRLMRDFKDMRARASLSTKASAQEADAAVANK
ncbi:MAG: hypothetical protein AAFX54_03445 [Pseudomonadota bacterium]